MAEAVIDVIADGRLVGTVASESREFLASFVPLKTQPARKYERRRADERRRICYPYLATGTLRNISGIWNFREFSENVAF